MIYQSYNHVAKMQRKTFTLKKKLCFKEAFKISA